MYDENKKTKEAFDFIKQASFDFFCLQEVPPEFLEQLKTLPCCVAYRSESEITYKSKTHSIYNVILTKYPVATQGEILFADYNPYGTIRSFITSAILGRFRFDTRRNRAAFYIDVQIDNQSVRVFNLHLALRHPLWREYEFEEGMKKFVIDKPTLVCGDFNILESLHTTFMNWGLGGRISDAIFYKRERTRREERFKELGLTNTLLGHMTHPFSQSQLDHILISSTFSVKSVEVVQNRMGSDHCVVKAEVTLLN